MTWSLKCRWQCYLASELLSCVSLVIASPITQRIWPGFHVHQFSCSELDYKTLEYPAFILCPLELLSYRGDIVWLIELQKFFSHFISCSLLKKNCLLIFDCAVSPLLSGLLSSCRELGLLSSHSAPASHCDGFSYCRTWALGCADFSSCGAWAQ